MKIKNLLGGKEVKNAGWLIGGKVFQMLLSLLVGVLTARYLGPGNYGLINYGNAYVSFFTALCNLGINSVIIKDFVDHPDEQGEAIGSTLLMRFVSSVLSAIMIIGIVSIVDRDEPLTVAVVALCSLGLIFHIFETINFWFQAQYKSKITALATLVAYVLTSAYKIVLLALDMDVRWFAFATSVDYILIAIFLLIAYKKYHGPKFSFSLKKGKSLLSVSAHYILSGMMVAIYGQTDRLMLKHITSEAEVGYYSVAFTVCTMWVFVLQAIIDSVYPTILRLHGTDKAAFKKKNRQLYAIVFYLSAFVSLMFLIFGDFGIWLLYGNDYAPAADILKIVTWYTAFSCLGVARNAWIVSEGKQKYLKYIYGCAAVMNILLNLLLIPSMGGKGAALASLISETSTSILIPLFFKGVRPNVKLIMEGILLKGFVKQKNQEKESS